MILRAEYAAWRAVLHIPEDRDGVVVELAWLISGRQPRTAVEIALEEPPADFLSWIRTVSGVNRALDSRERQ